MHTVGNDFLAEIEAIKTAITTGWSNRPHELRIDAFERADVRGHLVAVAGLT